MTFIVPHSISETKNNVLIVPVAKPSGRLQRMTRTVWNVWRKALKCNADLYIFHDPELLPVGLLLRACGRAAIYDAHENVAGAMESKDYLPQAILRILGWCAAMAEALICRRLSAVMTVTPQIAARLQKYNTRTFIVKNYPKLSELIPPAAVPWKQRELAVAYVGDLTFPRGLQQMVKAMGALPQDCPAKLKLAGKIDPPRRRGVVAELPGWERVEELGFLDRPSVATLLGQVRAGLVVLLPHANHITAIATKMYEYMAAGIPVIASDFPLWRQAIETHRCGLAVNPEDSAAIAEAIRHVLDHPEEAEAMGKRGRAAIEGGLNWETEAAKLLAFCDEFFGVKKS